MRRRHRCSSGRGTAWRRTRGSRAGRSRRWLRRKSSCRCAQNAGTRCRSSRGSRGSCRCAAKFPQCCSSRSGGGSARGPSRACSSGRFRRHAARAASAARRASGKRRAGVLPAPSCVHGMSPPSSCRAAQREYAGYRGSPFPPRAACRAGPLRRDSRRAPDLAPAPWCRAPSLRRQRSRRRSPPDSPARSAAAGADGASAHPSRRSRHRAQTEYARRAGHPVHCGPEGRTTPSRSRPSGVARQTGRRGSAAQASWQKASSSRRAASMRASSAGWSGSRRCSGPSGVMRRCAPSHTPPSGSAA